MSQQNLVQLAKQGNPEAIATLINHSLQPKGITAKVSIKQNCLQVLLESTLIPNQQVLVSTIRKGISSLGISNIQLQELKTANLSPASIEAISASIKSPPPLESLLDKINAEFAVPLLIQCQKIAQLDGVVNQEEARVIEMISQKFKLDLTSLAS